MTLYKATRPDGTDFHTGTVRWLPATHKLGRARTVRHPSNTVAVRGAHSTSLAVSTDPTRLPGARWPMRLAVVEPVAGVPVIETDTYKRQAIAWRVVAEVDPSIRFGPNGAHVAAVIDHEFDWGAAQNAAWDADWAAAWNATRNAARDAARRAAWDAAWDAAWGVAQDAALALVVRDLIGSHGLTQRHYDTLTGPWRRTIGPVHPDDPPIDEPATGGQR